MLQFGAMFPLYGNIELKPFSELLFQRLIPFLVHQMELYFEQIKKRQWWAPRIAVF